MLLVRLRGPAGQFRVQLPSDNVAVQSLAVEYCRQAGIAASDQVTLSNQPTGSRPFPATFSLKQCQIKQGDLLYVNHPVVQPTLDSASVDRVPESGAAVAIVADEVDRDLDNDPGLIERKQDARFCGRHGANAMCDYCMPLEPFDTVYLKEHKIKHVSFYAWLKQRKLQQQKISSDKNPSSSLIILEEPSFKVDERCSSGHAPYPKAMCAKCQPSAIVLKQQQFRMVDHVEFETPALIENFLVGWRQSGMQQFGYLYGYVKRYTDVPLGIKLVVAAVYTPPQISAVDGVELLDPVDDDCVNQLAAHFDMSCIGMIYTDLTDDGTGSGKVLCKRHSESFFISSAECVFIANKQLEHPFRTAKSTGGQFGSRFVSVVVTGDKEGNIGLNTYQVSNTCMGMVRDEIVDACTDPTLMRVRASTPTHYVPEVFYRYKNSYGVEVQEAAQPTFPVDYLLITATEGFPQKTETTFLGHATLPADVFAGNLSVIKSFLEKQQNIGFAVANFDFLKYLSQSGIMTESDLKSIVESVKSRSASNIEAELRNNTSWKTFLTLLNESSRTATSSSTSAVDWGCRHCTLINRGNRKDCEMCGLPKD